MDFVNMYGLGPEVRPILVSRGAAKRVRHLIMTGIITGQILSHLDTSLSCQGRVSVGLVDTYWLRTESHCNGRLSSKNMGLVLTQALLSQPCSRELQKLFYARGMNFRLLRHVEYIHAYLNYQILKLSILFIVWRKTHPALLA